jgi:hypothetical protein
MDHEKKTIVHKHIVLYILLLHLKAKVKLDLNNCTVASFLRFAHFKILCICLHSLDKM